MPSYESIALGLRWIACGFGIGAAVSLYRQSLLHRYRFLFAMLCFQALRSLALTAISSWWSLNLYPQVWLWTEPIAWLLCILLVLELYWLLAHNNRGLRAAGRWMYLIAATLAILTLTQGWAPLLRLGKFSVMFHFVVIDRGIAFGLVFLLSMVCLVAAWYRVSPGRNLLIHTGVCTIFLAGISTGYVASSVSGAIVSRVVHLASLLLTSLCAASWMLLLNRRGEPQ